MRIVQMLPSLAYGDAIGNDTVALKKCLEEQGYDTEIYAKHIDGRLPKGTAQEVSKMPHMNKDDVVLYHMSTGSELNEMFGNMKCKKVMIYHNITPPEMLEPYNKAAAADCREGYEELAKLADKVDYCIAVSEYNKQDLIKAGYKCKIDVLPILIAFDDYAKKPDAPLYGKYNDGVTNIIFTGRIAGNKCQQDVIHAFGLYQKYYNSNSRLILVGNDGGYETYKQKMQKYAQLNCIKNVIFTGHIKFSEILACYKAADLFLCMSEHEGFCVPLVEAMYFQIPVIAYNSSAIGETLGKGGILLNEKNALETAALMDRVLKDKELQKKIIANQNERLADFAHDKILARFNELLKENVL